MEPYKHWRALKPGYFEVKKQALDIEIVSLGYIQCPSGKLIIKDTISFSPYNQEYFKVIPGNYEIKATLVVQQETTMLAYLSLIFSASKGNQFEKLCPTRDNTGIHQKKQVEGFKNRSGYAMIVDESLLRLGLPIDDEQCHFMVHYWQNRIEDKKPNSESLFFDLDPESKKSELFVFKTRLNAGLTPVWNEIDEHGISTRFHIDLGLIPRLLDLDR